MPWAVAARPSRRSRSSVLRNRIRRSPGRFKAIAYAVLVHAAVIGVLVVGFRWSSQSLEMPGKVMRAQLVEEAARPDKDEELRKKAEAERRRREQARRKEEERQAALVEAEKKRRLAELAREQEEERRRAEEAERKRKQAETAKRRLAEEKRKKAEAERKRFAEEQQKKEQAERRRQAELALKEQLAAEEREREEAARAAYAAAEAEKYKALIRQKVSRNWSRPGGVGVGLQCVVRVRLVPGGEVLQAQVVRSSGNAMFDRSVENAVYKATPLPLPSDPALFSYFREIEFLFRPEG